jgi:hypothetical protein
VSALSCHDTGAGKVLLTEIVEEGSDVQTSDCGVRSVLLNDIAKAVDEELRRVEKSKGETSSPSNPQ